VNPESAPGETPVGSLLGRRPKQAWIPDEWHRDGATVYEIDGEEVVRDQDILHALTRPTL